MYRHVDRHVYRHMYRLWWSLCRRIPSCSTGGCALNVKANSRIADVTGLPVQVPAAPSDCGLSVGMVWHVQPPVVASQLAYAGLQLFDRDELQTWVEVGRHLRPKYFPTTTN